MIKGLIMLEMLLYTPESSGGVQTDKDYTIKQYDAKLSNSWIVPNNVTSICVVCVGHGSIGAGGLSWRNNIPVTPGETLTISFDVLGDTRLTRGSTVLCIAYSGVWPLQPSPYKNLGGKGGKNASSVNQGGGDGGSGMRFRADNAHWSAGGGAAGYYGKGGDAIDDKPATSTAGTEGSGSGGRVQVGSYANWNGGDVGLYGTGTTGASASATAPYNGNDGSPGKVMCGGGSCSISTDFNGGVRIIWGEGYSFPIYALNPDPYVNIIPVMLSNTTPVGYTATASSSFNHQTPPYIAFIRNTANKDSGWINTSTAPSGTMDQWLMIQLPFPEVVKMYQLAGYSAWGPIDSTLQGSNDGTVFTDLHTLVGRPSADWGTLKQYTVNNTQAYKYYRLRVTRVANGGYAFVNTLNLFRSV